MINALESVMLAAFSIGWYFSIFKMLKIGKVSGKSMGFVLLVLVGYMCGTTAKALYWLETDEGSMVLAVYAWNTFVVAADALLMVYIMQRARLQAPVTTGGGTASAPIRDMPRAPAATGPGQRMIALLDWILERDRLYREWSNLRRADSARLDDIGISRDQIDGFYRR